MKSVSVFAAVLMVAPPAFAQHVHDQNPPPAAAQQAAPIEVPWNDAIPAGTAEHAARALKESPRHGEWVDIKMSDGTILKSWVVYPEKAQKTGVVLVIHDIRGMADIPRAVGDQDRAGRVHRDRPGLPLGKGPNGGGTESLGTRGRADHPEAQCRRGQLPGSTRRWSGKKLPASNGKTAVVGFCWAGAQQLSATPAQPNLNAAVVFYGDAPGAGDGTVEAKLANVKAPVLSTLRRNDARIGATIPANERR